MQDNCPMCRASIIHVNKESEKEGEDPVGPDQQHEANDQQHEVDYQQQGENEQQHVTHDQPHEVQYQKHGAHDQQHRAQDQQYSPRPSSYGETLLHNNDDNGENQDENIINNQNINQVFQGNSTLRRRVFDNL